MRAKSVLILAVLVATLPVSGCTTVAPSPPVTTAEALQLTSQLSRITLMRQLQGNWIPQSDNRLNQVSIIRFRKTFQVNARYLVPHATTPLLHVSKSVQVIKNHLIVYFKKPDSNASSVYLAKMELWQDPDYPGQLLANYMSSKPSCPILSESSEFNNRASSPFTPYVKISGYCGGSAFLIKEPST